MFTQYKAIKKRVVHQSSSISPTTKQTIWGIITSSFTALNTAIFRVISNPVKLSIMKLNIIPGSTGTKRVNATVIYSTANHFRLQRSKLRPALSFVKIHQCDSWFEMGKQWVNKFGAQRDVSEKKERKCDLSAQRKRNSGRMMRVGLY